MRESMAADRRELLLGRWAVVTLLLSVLCSHLVVATSEKLPRTLSALSVVEGSEPSDVDEEAEVDDEGDPEDLEVFQPTHRWQTLRPGQAVPAGSHVRLNLQTGQREVKLDEEALKYWRNGKSQAGHGKHAVLVLHGSGAQGGLEEEEADLRSRFRSLDELKKDMAQLDMLVETDFQVMSRLMAQLNRSSATVEEKVSALLDLEYLVHQVDNAQDLVSMGGMKLVMDALNSTDVRLQESAAFVLGSALSGNPRVQVEAVEGGALQKLITLLATDRPLSVKKKVLFAVSSLLRNFPFAQSRFLKLGGVQVLGDLFRSPAGALLRVRIVTLLYDMLVEKELISEAGPDPLPDSSYQERLRQYAQVSLLPLLAEQGWCRLVPELLASPEHDWREKALRTLLAMMPRCRATYQMDPQLGHALGALQQQYRELALGEQDLGEDDRYFGEILELLDTVLLKVR
ncbi:nucleotide exchange factor SIL1-like [Scleropages formosus]|uniref:Nucleotide exchange factor SIL1 n=1 Tax=Scleropages formosus TaxID=113540 RepID=A0A0P7UYG5_SCLFO|nr:nucleotide exchange factor SIL1-like [Scleropages formosus]